MLVRLKSLTQKLVDWCLIVIVSFLLKESGVLIDWRQVFQVVRIGQFQLVKEIVEVLVIGEVGNLVEMRLLVMSDQFPYSCWLSFAFFHLGGNRKCNLLNGCVVWDTGKVLEFVSYYFEDVQSEVAWGSSREEERFLELIFPSSYALTFPFLAETPLRLFGWLIFAKGDDGQCSRP